MKLLCFAEDLDGPLVLLCMEALDRDTWLHPIELQDEDVESAKAAALEALSMAHAVLLPCGSTAVHGDLRIPNVLMSKSEAGALL
jgi:serine/threonine-protein kinase RIO1